MSSKPWLMQTKLSSCPGPASKDGGVYMTVQMMFGTGCHSVAQPWGGFPHCSAGKESACNAGDLTSIPGSGRSPGEGNDFPLQYSGLESPWDLQQSTRLSDAHWGDKRMPHRDSPNALGCAAGLAAADTAPVRTARWDRRASLWRGFGLTLVWPEPSAALWWSLAETHTPKLREGLQEGNLVPGESNPEVKLQAHLPEDRCGERRSDRGRTPTGSTWAHPFRRRARLFPTAGDSD